MRGEAYVTVSTLNEKLEVPQLNPGHRARRQLRSLVNQRGYKKLGVAGAELVSPFGDVTFWRHEDGARGMDAWLVQVYSAENAAQQ